MTRVGRGTTQTWQARQHGKLGAYLTQVLQLAQGLPGRGVAALRRGVERAARAPDIAQRRQLRPQLARLLRQPVPRLSIVKVKWATFLPATSPVRTGSSDAN